MGTVTVSNYLQDLYERINMADKLSSNPSLIWKSHVPLFIQIEVIDFYQDYFKMTSVIKIFKTLG